MCEINNEEIFYLAILKLNAISRGEENKPPETGVSLPDKESADEESADKQSIDEKSADERPRFVSKVLH